MRNDLQYDLCPGCGERSPRGIIEHVQHSCPLNTFTYYVSKFSIRQFHHLVSGESPLLPFQELLYFKHFQAMPGFDTASEIDKIIYSICRDSDIRTMKRLRAYIELEWKFDASC